MYVEIKELGWATIRPEESGRSISLPYKDIEFKVAYIPADFESLEQWQWLSVIVGAAFRKGIAVAQEYKKPVPPHCCLGRGGL